MTAPTNLPDSVRCYQCGRRQDPGSEACAKCGAVFRGLCACGVVHSLYATACGSCGRRLAAKRLPRSKHPAVRTARWVLVAAVVGAVGFVAWSRQKDLAPWALKERGLTAFREERYAEAARDFQSVTEQTPRDAQAWFNLALCWDRLGMSRDVVLGAARTAVERDPQFLDGWVAIAQFERTAGNADAASAAARTAAALPNATAAAHVMFAETTLVLPEPDLDQVIRSLSHALELDPQSAQAAVLLAECHLRRYGNLPPESVPPEVAAAVGRAKDALPKLEAAGLPRWQSCALRSRILLATGAKQEAYAAALEAVDAAPAGNVAGDVRASLLALRARTALAQFGSVVEARRDFLEALSASASFAAVAAVVEPLTDAGHADAAEEILGAALASGTKDEAGAIAFSIARLRLRRGDVAGAVASAERAVEARPADPLYALLEGDARRAAGDPERARAAYARAEATSPGDPTATAMRLLLALDAKTDRDAAIADARAAAERLRTQHPKSPIVLRTSALLDAAAGRADEAAAFAQAAAEAAPSSADAWMLAADLHLRSGGDGSATRAAVALSRVRRLRPEDPLAARREAEALLDSGDAASAAVAATRFLDRHPRDAGLLDVRARAMLRSRRWDAAAEDLRVLAAIRPRDVHVLLALAEAEQGRGDRDAALRALDEAARHAREADRDAIELRRLQISNADADTVIQTLRRQGHLRLVARVELASARLSAAEATARSILSVTPGDPGATEVLVFAILDRTEDAPEARAEAERAIAALAPTSPGWLAPMLRARILLGERRWDDAWAAISAVATDLPAAALPRFLLGAAAFHAGRVDEGLAHMRTALSLPGATKGIALQTADRLARAAADSRQHARAEGLARECLRIDGDHVLGARVLAAVLADRGEFALAAAAAERGLQSPRATPEECAELRGRAAAAHCSAGNPELALLHVDALEKLRPTDRSLDVLRGFAHLAAKRLDVADSHFRRAVAAEPDSVLPRMGIAYTALARDDVASAVEAARECVARQPSQFAAAVAMSRVFAARGRHAEAIEILRASAAANPSAWAPSDELVSALARAGRADEAVAVAERLAAATPDRRDAARLLVADALLAAPGGAEKAIAAARLARAVSTGSAQIATWSLEARGLVGLGRADEARVAADEGLRLFQAAGAPNAALEFQLRSARGLAALVAGRNAEALPDLRRCVELMPGDPVALNNAAWAASQLGTTDGATEALGLSRSATAARPTDPNLWSTRAAAAVAAKEDSEADGAFRECLRLLGDAPASDPGLRGRTAIRYSRWLRTSGRTELARRVAADVAGFTPAPPEAVLREALELARE